jgi:hypothetical protein
MFAQRVTAQHLLYLEGQAFEALLMSQHFRGRPAACTAAANRFLVRSRQTHSSLPIVEVVPSDNRDVVLFQHLPEMDGLRLQGRWCVCIG